MGASGKFVKIKFSHMIKNCFVGWLTQEQPEVAFPEGTTIRKLHYHHFQTRHCGNRFQITEIANRSPIITLECHNIPYHSQFQFLLMTTFSSDIRDPKRLEQQSLSNRGGKRGIKPIRLFSYKKDIIYTEQLPGL